MNWNLRQAIAPSIALLALCGWGVREARAGCCICDWLFGRRTSFFAPACPTPAVTVNTPVAVPSACGTGACGTVVQSPVVANVSPQTCCRTTWARVPVTTFRSVVATDPCTGCPVTTLRPCTTFRWQAFRACSPTVVQSPVVQSVTSGCSSCQTQQIVTPQTQVVVPQTSPQAIQQPMTTPIPSQQGGGSSVSPAPADQPPTLNMNRPVTGGDANQSSQSGGGSSSNNGAATNYNGASNGSYNYTSPSYTSPSGGTQGSSTRWTPPARQDRNAPPPPTTGSSSLRQNFRLLPDPDANSPSGGRSFNAPPLLDPREKTAHRPVRLTSGTASTSARGRVTQTGAIQPRHELAGQTFGAQPVRGRVLNRSRATVGAQPVAHQSANASSASQTWDDDGWRAVKQ